MTRAKWMRKPVAVLLAACLLLGSASAIAFASDTDGAGDTAVSVQENADSAAQQAVVETTAAGQETQVQ